METKGKGMKMMTKIGRLAAWALACAAGASPAAVVEVPVERFEAGGWSVDVQFLDLIGSPCLLAHGLGEPQPDAKAEVAFPRPGAWRLWVRTKNWADGAPGRFDVLVDGRRAGKTFGAGERRWAWEDGGLVTVGTRSVVTLRDLTGFDGRCAGLVFSDDPAFVPEGPLDVRTRPADETHDFDFVVVGGGQAGMAAALAAARRGVKTAIVQDRPVFGGNSSSEIRVTSCGERRHPIVSETEGHFLDWEVKDEFGTDDRRRLALLEREPALTPFTCCRAFGVETNGSSIAAVTAHDWRRGRTVRFRAKLFADCTGDGWVGFWAGADWRMGREARGETGETDAPDRADGETLGASIMWRSLSMRSEFPFTAPWAEPHAQAGAAVRGGWQWEHGIRRDMIAEGEEIRDRLLLAIYGSFSLAKKDPRNSRRRLVNVPFLLGKRESRRLMGDYVFSGNDIVGKTFFEDAVASGSWSIDLHFQDDRPGIDYLAKTTMDTSRRPFYGRYWLPYRSLYSRNVTNLFMAGRCFSCTHVGLGSPRVMNTLAQMGVAVGEAAALCRETGLSPRGLYAQGRMKDLQARIGGDFPGNVSPERRSWKIVDDETVELGSDWKKAWKIEGGQVGDRASYPTKSHAEQSNASYPLPVERKGRYRIYRRVPHEFWVMPDCVPRTHVDIVSEGRSVAASFDPVADGGKWVPIGDFDLAPGAKLVIVPSKSTGNLVADGFAIKPLAR